MVEGRKPVIGILTGDIQGTEHTRNLGRGFYSCAKEEGVDIIMMPHDEPTLHTESVYIVGNDGEDEKLREAIYDYVSRIKPDVLIIIYGNMSIWHKTDGLQAMLDRYADIPKLVFQDITEDGCGTASLSSDNYQGMKACVEHLVGHHGYKKLAFISGPKSNRDANERLNAFRDVMAAYQLPVDESLIAYGDYTEKVDAFVESFYETCPDLEAIVCANDHMAEGAYRVCKARGLVVGKDVAITGFDNTSIAQQIAPRMTTVDQSGITSSYEAIQMALDIIAGKEVESHRMPCNLVVRRSCGCRKNRDNSLEEGADIDAVRRWLVTRVDVACGEMFRDVPYKSYQLEMYYTFYGMVQLWCDEFFEAQNADFDFRRLVPHLEKMVHNPYISNALLSEYIVNLLSELAQEGATEEIRINMQRGIRYVRSYFQSAIEAKNRRVIKGVQQEAWFLCVFTRGIMSQRMSLQEALGHIMKSLKSLKVPSVYFYLRKNPYDREQDDTDPIYLSSYYTEDEMVSYPMDEWIPITEGIAADISAKSGQDGSVYFSFPIFSGMAQYGLMISRVDQDHMHFMMEVADQIGICLHMMYLREKQRQNTLEIERQNEVLAQISKTDAMTGLLNRRGFYDDAFRFLQERVGMKGVIFSVDLDHLKEINDTFGHEEGDYAINTAAFYLRECLPEDSLISRFGGDEYMALFTIEDTAEIDKICQSFDSLAEKTNRSNDKPYYVEVSVGHCEFKIMPGMKLSDITSEADKSLYMDKSKRRDSIVKGYEFYVDTAT